ALRSGAAKFEASDAERNQNIVVGGFDFLASPAGSEGLKAGIDQAWIQPVRLDRIGQRRHPQARQRFPFALPDRIEPLERRTQPVSGRSKNRVELSGVDRPVAASTNRVEFTSVPHCGRGGRLQTAGEMDSPRIRVVLSGWHADDSKGRSLCLG